MSFLNLSFVNHLTVIPAICALDDKFLSSLFPNAEVQKALTTQKTIAKSTVCTVLHGVMYCVLVKLSIPVAPNLLRQWTSLHLTMPTSLCAITNEKQHSENGRPPPKASQIMLHTRVNVIKVSFHFILIILCIYKICIILLKYWSLLQCWVSIVFWCAGPVVKTSIKIGLEAGAPGSNLPGTQLFFALVSIL